MTTIILTIVGILLAAVAALMIFFYGGAAFDAGVIGAAATTIQNAGTNVLAASQMFRSSEGRSALSMDELLAKRKYLSELPKINSTSRADDPTAQSFNGSMFLVQMGSAAIDREICLHLDKDMKNGLIVGGEPTRFESVQSLDALPKMGCGSYDDGSAKDYVFFSFADRDV